jgi:diguanylate cyclase (GGDEF)-like protein/PAS domain S-box-containing protein
MFSPRESAGSLGSDSLFGSSEELFRALAAHTPVGVFVSDANGACTFVNERWCELAGLAHDDATGDGWLAALHPDDRERVLAEWHVAAQDARDSVVEYRFLHPDGTSRWIQGFASALRDADGSVAGWVGTCLDLSERKAAEADAAEIAERFRVAFDNAPIGVALLTPDGRWFHVNKALCDLVGYAPAELYELTFADITHPEDLAGNLERNRQQLEGGTWERRIEKRYIRADGEVVWVALTNEVVRDASGLPLYFVAQIEDITQRRETENALRDAEERFRRAFEDAPIGMALVAPDGRFLRVNRTLCDLTRRREVELLGLTFQQITHPDDLDADIEQARRLLAGEISSYQMEKRYVRPDGSLVPVMLSVSLVRDSEGEPLHYVSQIEDITDRKRAEDELHHLANHDPLTGLVNRRRFDEELQRELRRLEREPDRRAALLLLDLDRFKAVNDSMGHRAGDDVLCAVARSLEHRLRGTDVVARLGGDEFAALLLDLHGSDDARQIASELAATIESQTILTVGGAARVTASIGVVALDHETGAREIDTLVAADNAMYSAKRAGRNRISLAA